MPDSDDPPYRSPSRRHQRRFFYKYVSSEVAKTILANRTLRWSSPLLFNDPFDVTQELRLNFNESELNQAVVEELAALYGEGPDPDYAPSGLRQRLLKTMMDSLQEHPELRRRIIEEWHRSAGATTPGQIEAMAELKEKWRNLVPRLRILCLSELNDVTPMWNHYADAYRGVVLEFEAVDRLDSAFLVARPVTYQDAPPAIANKEVWARCMSERGPSTYIELFTEYEYVKTTPWAHEREWRIVSFARDDEPGCFSDISFMTRELAGVYLGAQCSQDDENDILALLRHGLEHVSVYKASIVPTEARFTFQRIR